LIAKIIYPAGLVSQSVEFTTSHKCRTTIETLYVFGRFVQ